MIPLKPDCYGLELDFEIQPHSRPTFVSLSVQPIHVHKQDQIK